jgi:serine/threonine protein phosphatase PrpC
MKITVAAKTDVGRKRSNNEDTYLARSLWDDNNWLLAVIDGMGGIEGGEVAAELARENMEEYLQEFGNGERISLLKQAVTQANNRIVEEGRRNLALSGMGCVATACLLELKERRLNMAHVGDTRLYELRPGDTLRKLSHDHSPVGELEESGRLTEEEAMQHWRRNLIDRYLGEMTHNVEDEEFIEDATFPLVAGAIYLICSDGLHDMLTSAEMTDILRRPIPLGQKVDALIDAANEKGGRDNITVVLAETEEEEEEEVPVEQIITEQPLLPEEMSEQGDTPLETVETSTPARNGSRKSLLLGLLVGFLVGLLLGGWLDSFRYGRIRDKEPATITDSLRTDKPDSLSTLKDSLPATNPDTIGTTNPTDTTNPNPANAHE